MHQHRRRKKRPNYSTRSVDVVRGFNGFGFTISGQQPCILSCIVENSPADLAGLRTGDFLISVNGMNVYKLPHEAIVQLIGSSTGTIRIAIAENYYLDSSDEDATLLLHQKNQSRIRPKYPHHKVKTAVPQPRNQQSESLIEHRQQVHQVLSVIQDKSPLFSPEKSYFSPANINIPQSNQNEVIPPENMANIFPDQDQEHGAGASGILDANHKNLEYCTVVGYLGTIEMPTQIATSSKLQTVRSCIRKIRQEKRSPNVVLMTILPTCMTLRDKSKVLLAKYPSSRLSYVSNNSDNDNRFFGLVTTVIYADGQMCEAPDKIPHRNDVIISNSCHVFVVDPKLADHSAHIDKANHFQVICTQDPISNSCLEFPSTSEYVVNLIRNMYNLKCAQLSVAKPPLARNLNADSPPRRNLPQPDGVEANSPQPSNHSEITTTSSNSDSGIGFHNDCTNISDRILVVDFPAVPQPRNMQPNLRDPEMHPDLFGMRPLAISNDDCLGDIESGRNLRRNQPNAANHFKSKSMSDQVECDVRLNVRAMPDLRLLRKTVEDYTADSDVARNICFMPRTSGHMAPSDRGVGLSARSCDNMLMSYDQEMVSHRAASRVNMSTENISLLGAGPSKQHVFVQPKPVKKPRSSESRIRHRGEDARQQSLSASTSPQKNGPNLMSYKLSPKVFNVPNPVSQSVEDLSYHQQQGKKKSCTSSHSGSISGSLQDLCVASGKVAKAVMFSQHLSSTCSEPDLGNRVIQTNGSSPFRRWGQSSFRARQNEHARDYTQRRASSSESEFNTKSMTSDTKADDTDEADTAPPNGPLSWGTSFERLLDDPAGLHTFAEFLKKEFSAENIYFWTACERFRVLDESERQTTAQTIFDKHLAVGALEPVNVDSQARTTAQDNLQAANADLFTQAQKQIFNLMKFDSYQRFIRSDLYKRCLDAEVNHLPLPYPADQLDPVLRTSKKSVVTPKLKKSLSNAEDRRRKSLLPWHRKTARCKSKDRNEEPLNIKTLLFASTSSIPKAVAATACHTLNGHSEMASSRSSLSSFDAAFNQRLGNETDESKSGLCRVILSDGATTVVQTRPNESISEMVERLLEKRAIQYRAFEAFQSGCNKPLTLDAPSVSVVGKELTIDQRIVFKLDLPNRKVISVKSKTSKQLEEVLRPILHKYNYRLDEVQVLTRDCSETLDLTQSVTVTDGQRLQVVMKSTDNFDDISRSPTKVHQKPLKPPNTVYTNNINQVLPHPFCIPNSVLPQNAEPSTGPLHSAHPYPPPTHLDEITNKVFNELLQERVEAQTDQNNGSSNLPMDRQPESGSMRSAEWDTESGSSFFDRLRMNNAKKMEFLGRPIMEQPPTLVEEGSDALKKPLIAKWKAGVKLQVTHKSENHELLEGLKRAQRSRLEDQRGTEINFELPEFLKNKENYSKNKVRKLKPPEPIPLARSKFDQDASATVCQSRPQPAPRHSISKSASSPTKETAVPDLSFNSTTTTNSGHPDSSGSFQLNSSEDPATLSVGSYNHDYVDAMLPGCSDSLRGPPPLPPKPKVLPIKPSNWAGGHSSNAANLSGGSAKSTSLSPTKDTHPLTTPSQQSSYPYLDEPSSSFV